MKRDMEQLGARFPVSREWAVRRGYATTNELKELERRNLVYPGRLPKGARLPPTTNDAYTDRFVRDLTIIGMRWPAPIGDLRHRFVGANDRVIRILARHGLLVAAELYDGSLTPTLASALQTLGITSRKAFRAWVAKDDLDRLRKYRNIGQAPPVKHSLTLRVFAETKAGLERLRIHRGLKSCDELVEALVAEALRAGGLGRGRKI
jgi:hypothetical protein